LAWREPAEQPWLLAQDGKIAQAIAAVGQQHRQIS
jgi:hypothetical protein